MSFLTSRAAYDTVWHRGVYLKLLKTIPDVKLLKFVILEFQLETSSGERCRKNVWDMPIATFNNMKQQLNTTKTPYTWLKNKEMMMAKKECTNVWRMPAKCHFWRRL